MDGYHGNFDTLLAQALEFDAASLHLSGPERTQRSVRLRDDMATDTNALQALLHGCLLRSWLEDANSEGKRVAALVCICSQARSISPVISRPVLEILVRLCKDPRLFVQDCARCAVGHLVAASMPTEDGVHSTQGLGIASAVWLQASIQTLPLPQDVDDHKRRAWVEDISSSLGIGIGSMLLMETLASWLDLAPDLQEKYAKKLLDFGCDTPEMLTDLTLADFAELGFKPLHARRIIKLAASTCSAEGSEGEGATRLIGIGKFTSSIATCL